MSVRPQAPGARTLFPGAVVRFAAVADAADAADGFELVSANHGATTMLATDEDALLGLGFVEGLFEDSDVMALADALADPDRDRLPVVLRWGAAPPVDFLGVDLQRDVDGTVLAALHDQTDRHRLEGVMAGQGAQTLITDGHGKVSWISQRSRTFVGVDPEFAIGMHSFEIVHPDDHAVLARTDRELRANPGSEIVAWYRMRHPTSDEPWWWFRNTLVSLPDDPIIGGTIIVSQRVDGPPGPLDGTEGPADMTVAEMLPSGLIFSSRGRLQFRNSLARRMLGTAVEAIDAYRWVDVLRPGHRRQVHGALVAAVEEGRRSTVTAALDRSAETTLWLRIETMPSFDAMGTHVGYAATLLDVSTEHDALEDMQRNEHQLWHLANHDVLTGLPNRVHCLDRLGHALARTRREGRSTAVLFCDLDRFKQVNDEFGHAGGDALLVEVAHRLTSSIRETDTVSRLGGDEFVIVCEAFDDIADIEALARRLIAIVNEPILMVGGEAATVGLSVGIAEATAGSTADGLLDRADVAVYQAKVNGRNGFATAPADPHPSGARADGTR